MLVCGTKEVRVDGLEAKLQALIVLPCAWGIRSSKSTLPRNLKQTQQWGGYLTRLKKSGGTRHWKDGREWKFGHKDRKADKASDIRPLEGFGMPSILSSGFGRVVQQTLFSHNMGSALEST